MKNKIKRLIGIKTIFIANTIFVFLLIIIAITNIFLQSEIIKSNSFLAKQLNIIQPNYPQEKVITKEVIINKYITNVSYFKINNMIYEIENRINNCGNYHEIIENLKSEKNSEILYNKLRDIGSELICRDKIIEKLLEDKFKTLYEKDKSLIWQFSNIIKLNKINNDSLILPYKEIINLILENQYEQSLLLIKNQNIKNKENLLNEINKLQTLKNKLHETKKLLTDEIYMKNFSHD